MAHHNTNIDIHDEENYDPTVWVPKAHSHGTKALWRTFWFLFFVTILDILLYFQLDPGMFRNIVFIGLGIMKAAFIVYIFMHLHYEQKVLKMTIVLPMIFVVYLIIWLLQEAHVWNTLIW
ncbi:MAG: cytochrome C oxidase subunit IV family protein [Flavobacteriales bacterium]|nr:cytochrome C oxidase subunit IV family protein [Bacteroidota bacterium]MCB9241761.1 cytochrome C oxidase subunit IV family protein [Flavobacteriales bacterium]